MGRRPDRGPGSARVGLGAGSPAGYPAAVKPLPVNVAVFLTSPDVPGFNFTDRHARRLAEATGAQVHVCGSDAEFAERLPKADVALAWRFRPEWRPLAARLRWLATPAAGRDFMDALDGTLPFAVTFGTFHGEFMAETLLAMALAEVRGLTEAIRRQRAGEPWPREPVGRAATGLRGRHMVIVGFGHIGEWIAKLAKPFGVRITAVRRHSTRKPACLDAHDRTIAVGELDRVLPATDDLVLVLPREPDSAHLLDARRLALLPRHAVVYSIGRGHCIDEAALADALRRGRLRAAYLDVFETEPLPVDSPLRNCPHAVLMPHASAASPHYMDRFTDEIVAQFSRYAGGSSADPAKARRDKSGARPRIARRGTRG